MLCQLELPARARPSPSLWKCTAPGLSLAGRAGPRAHTAFWAAVWAGHGSRDPRGAGLALEPRVGTAVVPPGPGLQGTTTQPRTAPSANHGISNQKEKETPKKAFCQSSPWLIPADLVEVADWHQSGHSWHCPVPLGWRWLCPLPPSSSSSSPGRALAHHFGFLPVSTVSSSEPTASFSKDFTIL